MTLDFHGNYRLDGDASFDSLLLLAGGFNRFELNGTLAPARTTPQFIEFRGILGGNGKLLGTFDDGTIDPGAPGEPGRLTVNRMASGGLHVDLAGPLAGKDYDQLVILDRVLKLSQLQVNVATDFLPAPGGTFLILDNQGVFPSTATFTEFSEGTVFEADGTSFQISYLAGDGNDVSLTVVPEPAALVTVAFVFPILLGRRRR